MLKRAYEQRAHDLRVCKEQVPCVTGCLDFGNGWMGVLYFVVKILQGWFRQQWWTGMKVSARSEVSRVWGVGGRANKMRWKGNCEFKEVYETESWRENTPLSPLSPHCSSLPFSLTHTQTAQLQLVKPLLQWRRKSPIIFFFLHFSGVPLDDLSFSELDIRIL